MVGWGWVNGGGVAQGRKHMERIACRNCLQLPQLPASSFFTGRPVGLPQVVQKTLVPPSPPSSAGAQQGPTGGGAGDGAAHGVQGRVPRPHRALCARPEVQGGDGDRGGRAVHCAQRGPRWSLPTALHVFICVHMCSCVYTCVHVYSHVFMWFMCIHMCSYVFTCVHICSHVFMYVHMCEHVRVCVRCF